MPHSSPNSLLTPITPGSPHTSQAVKTFCRHLEHVYKRTIDPASRAEALTNLKSATHRYHTCHCCQAEILLFTHSLQLFQPSTPLQSSQLSSSSQISLSNP